ncbi:MAG: hypothetical protein ABIZ49_08345, partial [Opitutaceae bacterium]
MKIAGVLLMVVAVATQTASVWAQPGAPIYVAFRFEEPGLAGSFGSPEARIAEENKVSVRLAKFFHDEFDWWDFKASDSAQQFPRIEVKLGAPLDWRVYLQFFVEAGLPAEGEWDGLLFKPADFGSSISRLRREGWGPSVEEKIKLNVLTTQGKAEIGAKLRDKAPLGFAVSLPAAPFDAENLPVILPLDWRKYQPLGGSIFTITCRSASGLVRLHSEGVAVPVQVTSFGPPFEGLKVVLKLWETFPSAPAPIGE